MLSLRRNAGFTLAELLISLVILGVIATFAIPKVLVSQQDQQKKAVLKETFAAIENVMQEGIIDGQLCQNPQAYFRTHLNYIKICTSNLVTEGCWSSPTMMCGASDFGQHDGYVLSNGASLADFDTNSVCNGSSQEGIAVDWNGPNNGPNTEGIDQIGVWLNYQANGANRAGTVIAETNCAASTTYFNSQLWQ